jgi:hypothetical protein
MKQAEVKRVKEGKLVCVREFEDNKAKNERF